MSTLGKAYQEALEKISKRIESEIEGTKEVIYSAYEYDEYDNPIDNLDDIPVKGKVMLIDSGSFFDWMDDQKRPYKPFKSEVLNSPTWLEIAVEANKMIHTTNNRHHIYLEDVREIEWEGDVLILQFVMGS